LRTLELIQRVKEVVNEVLMVNKAAYMDVMTTVMNVMTTVMKSYMKMIAGDNYYVFKHDGCLST
jgi:hypothetical protein